MYKSWYKYKYHGATDIWAEKINLHSGHLSDDISGHLSDNISIKSKNICGQLSDYHNLYLYSIPCKVLYESVLVDQLL